MRSSLRTSTAVLASLSLVMGQLPVAAIAQSFEPGQCAEGEDDAACLERVMQEAAAAEEVAQRAAEQVAIEEAAAQEAAQLAEADAARLADEAAAAEEAARIAAEQDAAAQAAAEQAAQAAAEAAATEEAARIAAEDAERLAAEAAQEAARVAAEQAAADAAAQAVAEQAAQAAAEAAAAEQAAGIAAQSAAAEDAARLAAEQAVAAEAEAAQAARLAAELEAAAAAITMIEEPTEPSPTPTEPAPAPTAEAATDTAPDAPISDADALAAALAAAEQAESDDAAADAPADGTQDPVADAPADAAAPVSTTETATAPGPDAPISDADALAAALAAAAAGEAVLLDPEESSSPEDQAALATAQAAAEAAELTAAEPVDPIAEAEAEIAAEQSAAEEVQQSLALMSEAEPTTPPVTEIITEETARQPDEDFGQLLTATTDTVQTTRSDNRDRTGLTGTQGLIVGGLAAIAIGAIISGNRKVVNRADDRLVVLRPDGNYQVIRDDDTLLRRPGNAVVTEGFADGSSRSVITQPDGTQVITVRDRDLRILQRTAIAPDGRRTVLIDDTIMQRPVIVSQLPPVRPGAALVSQGSALDTAALALALRSQSPVERNFSLGQVRSIRAVRDLAPALNLESVTFASGSAAITPDQATQLLALGRYMSDTIARNPREMFLIEGHTDATGSASFNLGLSDRRAETVALSLSEYFGVPAQNMVIQGYGEEFLLVPTLANERSNRRVAVRRITDLLRVAAAN